MEHQTKRLKFSPLPGTYPLQDAETGLALCADQLGLDTALSEKIAVWDALYQNTRAQNIPFESLEQERDWVQQGQQIATAIAANWTGPLLIRISRLEIIVQQSMRSLQPEAWYSETHAQSIARHCGIAEIARAIERLNELAIEKSNIPQWDDDLHEDVAKAQRLLAQTLAAVPSQYLDDIAQGLQSPHSGTRVYVAIAMAKHGQSALPHLLKARMEEQDPVTNKLLDKVIEPLQSTASQ